MIEISKNITVEGFKNKEEFDRWLKEQEKTETNEIVLKIFKWSLKELEENTSNYIYNKNYWDRVDKYAEKMINRKIMSEDKIIEFIKEATSSIFVE